MIGEKTWLHSLLILLLSCAWFVGKSTRLILRGWWVLHNNSFVSLDKSTKLATFGTLGTFGTRY